MTANLGVAFLLAVLGGTVVAAPQTATPGQMTEAHVRIDNRGRGEAIPVDLRDVNVAAPLLVQVVNGDVAHPTLPPVAIRPVRPTWEYTTVAVAAAPDVVRVLTARGADGWETTGITLPAADGVTILLKRMR